MSNDKAQIHIRLKCVALSLTDTQRALSKHRHMCSSIMYEHAYTDKVNMNPLHLI